MAISKMALEAVTIEWDSQNASEDRHVCPLVLTVHTSILTSSMVSLLLVHAHSIVTTSSAILEITIASGNDFKRL